MNSNYGLFGMKAGKWVTFLAKTRDSILVPVQILTPYLTFFFLCLHATFWLNRDGLHAEKLEFQVSTNIQELRGRFKKKQWKVRNQ